MTKLVVVITELVLERNSYVIVEHSNIYRIRLTGNSGIMLAIIQM